MFLWFVVQIFRRGSRQIARNFGTEFHFYCNNPSSNYDPEFFLAAATTTKGVQCTDRKWIPWINIDFGCLQMGCTRADIHQATLPHDHYVYLGTRIKGCSIVKELMVDYSLHIVLWNECTSHLSSFFLSTRKRKVPQHTLAHPPNLIAN